MNMTHTPSQLVMRRTALTLALLWAGWWVYFATGDAVVSHKFVGGIIFVALVIGIVATAWKWPAVGGVLLVLASIASICIWEPMWIRRFGFWQIALMFAIMPLPPLVAGVLLLQSRDGWIESFRQVLGRSGS